MDDDFKKIVMEMHSDVRYLRQSFDDHKEDFKEHTRQDKQIQKDFLLPLWNAHQRSIGMKLVGSCFIAVIGAISGYFGGHR